MAPIVLRRAGMVIPIVMASLAGPSEAAGEDLGSGASAVYGKYCRECHAGRSPKGPRFDPADRPGLVALPVGGAPLVVPGKPEESLLWRRLGVDNEMPPKKKAQPSPEEKDLIRRWIIEGAPAPSATDEARTEGRRPLLERDAMKVMIRYLEGLSEEDRRHQRFFTLTVPYNREILGSPGRRPPSLSIYRAALSKAVNGLSLGRDIVLPLAIDEEKTVYAVDLRDLDWEGTWRRVLAAYPFGLKPGEAGPFESFETLNRLVGGEGLPYVRADWFIANASQPPLYHSMLRLPEKLEDLEAGLGVDAVDNFLKGRVARAGFHESGVSEQNRLVERHRTRHGAYWKSYDFKPRANDDSGNIFLRPLGPSFAGNPNVGLAFRHDGGEIIFSLPNGLQGYYLADAKGNRLDKAPAEIVNTPDPIEADSRIVTGISCIACHKEGMKGVKGSPGTKALRDEIRETFPVGGEVRKQIERRHPRPDDFNALLEKDRKRFLGALREATAPFLEDGRGAEVEVISVVARDYFRKLELDDLLVELGYTKDLDRHRDEVRACLRNLALAVNETPAVARRDWQGASGETGRSSFQAAASKLELGDPQNFSLIAR